MQQLWSRNTLQNLLDLKFTWRIWEGAGEGVGETLLVWPSDFVGVFSSGVPLDCGFSGVVASGVDAGIAGEPEVFWEAEFVWSCCGDAWGWIWAVAGNVWHTGGIAFC